MECHKGFEHCSNRLIVGVRPKSLFRGHDIPKVAKKKSERMMQGLLNASEMHAGECLKSLQDKWGPSCKELYIHQFFGSVSIRLKTENQQMF